MLVRILVLTADGPLGERLSRLAASDDVHVATAPAEGGFWQRFGNLDSDLVLVEKSVLPEPAPEVVDQLRGMPDRPEVVVIAAREDAGERASLQAAGCLAVLWSGLSDAALAETLGALVERRRGESLTRLAAVETEELSRLGDFVSHSPAMKKFLQIAHKVSGTDSTVLLLGETGVGKERLARALHLEGRRADGPFVVVNCGAVPETLWESELFGHEAGAFTGADSARRGYVELAHGGTLFLDEVGDMPLHLQVKLLRVLQERRIQRVGAEQPTDVDVRVLAATNRDLRSDMEEGRFRPDLYYRLSVVTMTIPPLRERSEDIRALANSYREHFAEQMNKRVEAISPEALDALLAYSWPGNIRELVNVIERAVILAEEAITLDDLPEGIAGERLRPELAVAESHADSEHGIDESWLAMSLVEARREWVDRLERAYLAALLERTRGRIGETAERAGIDPRSLYSKMRYHGLRKEDFRPGRPAGAEPSSESP